LNLLKRTLLLLVLGIGSISFAIAQSEAPTTSQALKIGDNVPDIVFENIINNGKQTSFKLSDFKGKLVILDFMATWCVPCIRALPKLDSLQSTYKDKLKIIPITYENPETMNRMLKINDNLKGVTLPFVTKTELRHYFPYRLIPHEIWIDEEGKIVAITNELEVTEQNIKKHLEEKALALKPKVDVVKFDSKLPLLAGAMGDVKFDRNYLSYSSVITKYIPGISSMQASTSIAGDKSKVICTNVKLQQLYQTAFAYVLGETRNTWSPNLYLLFQSRLLWEAKDSTLYYFKGITKNWKSIPDSVKLFSYELIMPAKDRPMLMKYMVEDLNRYFGRTYGIEGIKEVRKVKCWAFKKFGPDSLIVTKGGKLENYANEHERKVSAKNITINRFLVDWIGFCQYYNPLPIIDETGYRLPVDFEFDANPKDFDEMNRAFERYGLRFELVERDLEMIIIRDIKK
jgi:thiol-disulfide isomerase/thioredoxin